MADKNIGANIGGPEDRVVSANLVSGYFVAYAGGTTPLNWAYARRFMYKEVLADRKLIADLVPKNGDGNIIDSVGPTAPYPDSRLIFLPHIRSSKAFSQGKVYWTPREVFVDGVSIFTPIMPTVPDVTFTQNSFRAILGVSPVTTAVIEEVVHQVLYAYYFLWDRGRDLQGMAGAYRMREISGAFAEVMTSKICFLCCDKYEKVGAGAWSMVKQTVRDIPDAVFANGTPKGFRSLVTGATPLSFNAAGEGVSIATVRSVAARRVAGTSARPRVVELANKIGVIPMTQNINYSHCPRYPINTGTAFGYWTSKDISGVALATPYYGVMRADAWTTGNYLYVGDSIFNSGPSTEGVMLFRRNTEMSWGPFWQEEINYILAVSKDTVTFTPDVNTLQVNVGNAGGSTSLPSIYALGRSRLLCTFEATIYVP